MPLPIPLEDSGERLEIPENEGVSAALRPWQEQDRFLNIRTGHALIMSRRPRCACAIVTIPFSIVKRRLYAVVQTSRRTAF